MNTRLLTILASASLLALAHTNLTAAEYKAVPDWLTLPEGRTQIGDMHGDVAVSSK